MKKIKFLFILVLSLLFFSGCVSSSERLKRHLYGDLEIVEKSFEELNIDKKNDTFYVRASSSISDYVIETLVEKGYKAEYVRYFPEDIKKWPCKIVCPDYTYTFNIYPEKGYNKESQTYNVRLMKCYPGKVVIYNSNFTFYRDLKNGRKSLEWQKASWRTWLKEYM